MAAAPPNISLTKLARLIRFTLWPTVAETDFRRGIVRDMPRSAIPPGGVYDATDFLFDRPGMTYKRGGTAFASSTVGAGDSMVILVAVAAPEFPGDPRLVVIGSDGATTRKLYDVTSGTPAAAQALNRQPYENPPTYIDKLILTDGTGALTPKKASIVATVVTVADLGGLPPAATYSCVHLGYLVLANNTTNPNRLWFSPIPNIEGTGYAVTGVSTGSKTFTVATDHTAIFPAGQKFQVWGSTGNNGTYTVVSAVFGTSTVITVSETVPNATVDGTLGFGWNQQEAYNDCAGPISGLASVAGVLVVFTRGGCQRVVGSIPPGTVGENMEIQPISSRVGCIDARSIVSVNDTVYFAHESGIYSTSGSGITPLTTKADGTGIGTLWRSFTTDLDPVLGAVVCSGIYSNEWMFTSIRHPSGPDVQFICHLPTGSFTKTSINIACDMYAGRSAPHAEMYGTNAATSAPVRPLQFKGLFSPVSGNKNDADGAAVTPVLETRMIGQGTGLKAYGHGHLTYDMRDAATDNPTLAMTIATGIEADSGYAALTESPLAKVTVATRKRYQLNKDAQAAQLKFTQTNASSKTEIYTIESEVRDYSLIAETQ